MMSMNLSHNAILNIKSSADYRCIISGIMQNANLTEKSGTL